MVATAGGGKRQAKGGLNAPFRQRCRQTVAQRTPCCSVPAGPPITKTAWLNTLSHQKHARSRPQHAACVHGCTVITCSMCAWLHCDGSAPCGLVISSAATGIRATRGRLAKSRAAAASACRLADSGLDSSCEAGAREGRQRCSRQAVDAAKAGTALKSAGGCRGGGKAVQAQPPQAQPSLKVITEPPNQRISPWWRSSPRRCWSAARKRGAGRGWRRVAAV